jgi:uncharacterized damage-inducible protein DinB
MAGPGTLEMVHTLYDYHWWANHRLFDVAAALGEEIARRELGKHWSFPTLKGMLAHLYAADSVWLSRWRGTSPTRAPGDADFPTLAALRPRWADVEAEQRTFLQGLAPEALGRTVEWTNIEGKPFQLALWPLLQHVANHATHHRSEIATMLTMVSGSPPPTDMTVFHALRTGQTR